MVEETKSGDQGLRDWFGKSKSSDGKKGWVQLGGKYAGKPCARQPGQTSTPKCGSSKMKRNLDKDEEETAFRRKNRQDPDQPQKSGGAKPTNVRTEEMEEGFRHSQSQSRIDLYKKQTNRKYKKMYDSGYKVATGKGTPEDEKTHAKSKEQIGKMSAVDNYMRQIGKPGKKKGLPKTQGEKDAVAMAKKRMKPEDKEKQAAKNKNYEYDIMGEQVEVIEAKDKPGKGSGTKDACYHKVKSRYDVWPSAYASGALVKCRKKGAANWGNSPKNEEFLALPEMTDIQINAMRKAGIEVEVVNEDSRRTSNKQQTARVKANIKSFGSNYTPPNNYDPDANRGQGEVLTRKQIEKKRRKSLRQEEVSVYDIILSHLLDEGYAETPEAAEAIMVNMSEEWRESIVEEVISEGEKPFPHEKVERKQKALRSQGGNALDRRMKMGLARRRAKEAEKTGGSQKDAGKGWYHGK